MSEPRLPRRSPAVAPASQDWAAGVPPDAPSEARPVAAPRWVLGMRVDATTYEDAAETVIGWAAAREARYVCAANVHMVMEAHDDPAFQEVVNDAALVTSDGMPLVWALRLLGVPDASRVYGPTLMLHVCERAAIAGVPVGFYGSRPEVVDALVARLTELYPGLQVAYAVAPPFGPRSHEAEVADAAAVAASGTRVLFVGLGCPKQERWMHTHRAALPLVQLGVGAAFDFHAGAVRQAPAWLQRIGLEWAYRVAMEPRRLAGRYLKHNPRFVVLFARQLLGRVARLACF